MEDRPKRSKAGSKIGNLINQELKDDFYSTAYGGFGEESNDEEYESECSVEDEVDSDFDVDESKWGPEDDAEDKLQKDLKAQMKKKIWIKPYKDRSISSGLLSYKKPRPESSEMAAAPPPNTSAAMPSNTMEQASRNFRKSTQETSRGFRRRFEEEQLLRKRRRRTNPRDRDRKLTQEELLEEAKWTEMENLASLEAYTRMEEERKKVKLKKKPWTGPVVRYLSLTMPIVTEIDEKGGGAGGDSGASMEGRGGGSAEGVASRTGLTEVSETKEVRFLENSNKDAPLSVVGVGESALSPTPMDVSMSSVTSASPLEQAASSQEGGPPADIAVTATPTEPLQAQCAQAEIHKQSRNFLIFTDTSKYPSEYFPCVRPQKPKRRLCPVTRLPAKYIDPLTRTPYATPFAFKVIRTRYVNEAEQKCERRLLQLSSWLEEKKKKKMETS